MATVSPLCTAALSTGKEFAQSCATMRSYRVTANLYEQNSLTDTSTILVCLFEHALMVVVQTTTRPFQSTNDVLPAPRPGYASRKLKIAALLQLCFYALLPTTTQVQ